MEARFIEPLPQGPAQPAFNPLNSIGKLVAGLFFTAAGILLTADNLDLLDAERYLRYWPALLVLVGLLKFLDPRGSRIVASLLSVAGAWLLALSLHWIDFTLFDLWPLVLIAIGTGFVLRAFGVNPGAKRPEFLSRSDLAFFSTRKVAETSFDYRGANLVALLGGHELDLTGADITSGPAVIDAFAFWGGIEIIVPDNWEVVSEVTPVMAGFEASSGPNADPKKRLIIRGAAIMAGIEVKNASRRKS